MVFDSILNTRELIHAGHRQIKSALRALWKVFLRVIINNYKFYDLTPGYQLLAVERRELLMLVDTIKAEMEERSTEDLGLVERLLDDDGMGFRGRQQSEDDHLYFKVEKFHRVLDAENRKLDTNDEINEVFKGLDFPEEFYCPRKIESIRRLFVADYFYYVLIIRRDKEEKQLVHTPELDKYSIRSSVDINSMNGPQYHQNQIAAEHAESSSSAQAIFYGDDAHIPPSLQWGMSQIDINSHSRGSAESHIRDAPSNRGDVGGTYTRASDDSWPHHNLS
ncbi:hypothetical protein SeLEV6574_g06842 [Synchytrium endobioticum]|uniref:Uncharacterized protein n=1 Tax=Synchytrium endobioticum TaxID=286115 RepID=A0A507CM27_9FUNG|nr:hypothetical protein SeLEV6574_g06842 [Synchytrium endobioticum]